MENDKRQSFNIKKLEEMTKTKTSLSQLQQMNDTWGGWLLLKRKLFSSPQQLVPPAQSYRYRSSDLSRQHAAENKAQPQLAAGADGPLMSSEEPQAYTLKKEKAPKRQKLLRA